MYIYIYTCVLTEYMCRRVNIHQIATSKKHGTCSRRVVGSGDETDHNISIYFVANSTLIVI